MSGPLYSFVYHYSREWRAWACCQVDQEGNQLGPAGYGRSKPDAKSDWEYQQRICGA